LSIESRCAVLYTDRGKTAVKRYFLRTLLAEERYDIEDVKVFRVFGGEGKLVEKTKLSPLLKEETLVLVSANGRPVDPLHLRLVKEGTLIFVLPVPTAPPAVVPAAPPVVVPGPTPGYVLPAVPSTGPPPLPAPPLAPPKDE
jgi:hypothetical protein